MRLSEQQLTKVVKYYGREFVGVKFIRGGYRNTSHVVQLANGELGNVIVYKREPAVEQLIQRVNDLSTFLYQAGLPVRTPLDTRILRLRYGHIDRFACMYNFVDGETIPWEAYTKKHIKLLGMALAKLLSAAALYDGNLPSASDKYLEITERIKRYFSDETVADAVERKLGIRLNIAFDDMAQFVTACGDLAGQQALHMDFVRGNILFRPAQKNDTLFIDGVALSGIIDLEKAAFGHPLFDIGRTLAFLLVDCPKPKQKIYKYFIDSGYQKRGDLRVGRTTIEGTDVLEGLVTMFLIYDFYKFLKQNPYESLNDNHHFRRTRDILVERKVLQLV